MAQPRSGQGYEMTEEEQLVSKRFAEEEAFRTVVRCLDECDMLYEPTFHRALRWATQRDNPTRCLNCLSALAATRHVRARERADERAIMCTSSREARRDALFNALVAQLPEAFLEPPADAQ